jgi:hypothetical protein
MTAQWRQQTGAPKRHGYDAAVMVWKEYQVTWPLQEYTILPRRRRVWEANPTKKHPERFGFRHWDLVSAERAGRVVVGCVRSLKEKQLALRTAKDMNFLVS